MIELLNFDKGNVNSKNNKNFLNLFNKGNYTLIKNEYIKKCYTINLLSIVDKSTNSICNIWINTDSNIITNYIVNIQSFPYNIEFGVNYIRIQNFDINDLDMLNYLYFYNDTSVTPDSNIVLNQNVETNYILFNVSSNTLSFNYMVQ